MATAAPYKVGGNDESTRTVAIVDYNSKFTRGIEKKILDFNKKKS